VLEEHNKKARCWKSTIKRQNKRLASTDKRNNGKTKNKYRHDTKQSRDRLHRKGQNN
jgi:hypothetical protein